MKISRDSVTHTTFTAERKLSIEPPLFDAFRGLRYWPDMDEVAAKEAKSFHDAATAAIREQMKSTEAGVSLSVEVRGDELWAVCTGKKVIR